MATTGAVSPLQQQLRSLQGKVVMVTGASAGLGREMCMDLARSGCKVVVAARRADLLRSLVDDINAISPDGSIAAAAVELDVSSGGKAVEDAISKAWAAFGRIDALVNNAGIRGSVHTPFDLTEEEMKRLLATNLEGTWLVTKHVCSRMRDAKLPGSVVNISSTAGLDRGRLPGGLGYAASKAAVNSITRSMAMEFAKYNIRVNCISPGLFKSDITRVLMEKEWMKKVEMKTIPLRTHGTSDPALTALVRYLIDASSQYVTGNIFIVDAGATLPGVPIFSSL